VKRFAWLALLPLCAATLRAAPEPEAGVVEITASFQEHDPFYPWQKRQPGLRRGYGVRIGERLVITTESLVRNCELVELRKPRTGEMIPAAVEMSDCQCNLACLRVDDPAVLGDLRAVAPARAVAASNRVAILQLDETSQLQRGEGQIFQISVTQLPRAPYASLSFSLLTDLNVNGEGAPVLCDGALAGLMMSYNWNTRTGLMLPYTVIRRFLDDLAAPPYRGVASAGFIWQDLVDPVKRAYLGVGNRAGGIQVLTCLPGSGAAETLRPNDVVLKWDGCVVDNLGFYEDADFGRLGFPYLIMGHRKPGDAVPVTIVRDGREIALSVSLARYREEQALVPENVVGEKPEYLVDGGLIIREVDGRYLTSRGADWQQNADARLAFLYLTRRYSPSRAGERVVVLAGVLPDPVNIGYQHLSDEVVTAVNGQTVANMADVFRLADATGGLRRVTLQGAGVDLALDAAELPAANARLSATYRIPELRYQKHQTR
jgi:hypothetical protein